MNSATPGLLKRLKPACSARVSLALCAAAIVTHVTAQASVPAQDSRNTKIITTDSHLALPSFKNLQAWEARKANLRNQILVSAGLSPLPEKTPLHPQVFAKIEGNGYTIEKVLIETLPGFWLGGNLYRPRDNRPKHPGILNPHGHWQYGRLENEPIDSGPAFGISLARQGYVVFAYDMVGYTDTIQVPHRFGSARQRLWSFGPLGLQLWDSIRALDFLISLDDVDLDRIGAAGASGGATQTFLLTAIDDRVQFASPVNMVSAIMQGGDLCENAPGLRIGTSNVEIAAMFAPKPMLLVSDTTDWTRNMPRDEYPAIKRIYDLYGKGDQVSMVQIEAVHNFNQQSREAVYRFFAQVNLGWSGPATLPEHNITVPMLQEMMALSNRALPPGALDLEGLFKEWRSMAEAQSARAQDRAFLRQRLRQTLAVEVPAEVIDQIDGQKIVLSRPHRGDRVPGIWIAGQGAIAIVVDPQGADAALKSPEAAHLRMDHCPILAIDAFQTGRARAPRERDDSMAVVPDTNDNSDLEHRADLAAGGPKFLTFNVTDDQARVEDIVTAITWARNQNANVEVYASGKAALWATFAAAMLPSSVTLHLTNQPRMESDDDYLENFNVPGILRAGGLPAAIELAGAP